MAEPKKATCCYCGRYTVLRNTAHDGHALACGSCGAPLTMMKPLKPERARSAGKHAPAANPKPVRGKHRGKKKKGFLRKMAEEIFDEIEDIFD